jgi:enoyl-CoA hydratase/carnithine racemase
VSESGRSVFARIVELEIPTLAAINGAVVGDGLALALACDIRLAGEGASFRLPELGYGFIPGWGPIRSLVSLVGRGHATGMLLTGRAYAATEAHLIGLVHEVVPQDRLEEVAMARARALATASAPAVRSAKRALGGGDERGCFEQVWGSRDWEEGIEALLGKRAPVFGRSGA